MWLLNFKSKVGTISLMSKYQLTLVLKNDLDEKKRTELLQEVTKALGTTTKEDLWGNKNLAYPIKHQDRAYFAHYEFETEPKSIISLDKMVKLNEDILRYLLIRR